MGGQTELYADCNSDEVSQFEIIFLGNTSTHKQAISLKAHLVLFYVLSASPRCSEDFVRCSAEEQV